MLITHMGKTPVVDPTAYVAPNATVCGDVRIGANCRILFGAQIIAEGGSIAIGEECIVMENAVLRSNANHSLRIGNNCLIGPTAHVVGCIVEDEVFIATGAVIFHGAHLQQGCEVRVHGIVHVKSKVHAGDTIPIGWIAVGDPAAILPLEDHEKVWELLKPMNFPYTVYGFDRSEADMVKITRRLAGNLASHRDDDVVDAGP